MISLDELDEIFNEQFPYELDKKVLHHFFRKYARHSDKNIISYERMKADLNPKILNYEKTQLMKTSASD